MKFYPGLNLYSHYKKHLPTSSFFSARIFDQTTKNSLDNLNRAMNVCEKHDSFLDFGAGNGRYSTALLPEFKKGFAIEIEQDKHLSAIAQNKQNLSVIFGSKAITKIKQKIDFIILMDVIEHIPTTKIRAFVKQLSQLQKIGGVIYISTPNAVCCGMVEKSGIYYKRFQFGHHKHYVAEELVLMFSKFGYKPVLLTYEDFPFRLWIKQLNLGSSYLDKKLLNIPFYAYLSMPVIFVLNLVFSFISPFVSLDEYKKRNDNLCSRTTLLTLKKLS